LTLHIVVNSNFVVENLTGGLIIFEPFNNNNNKKKIIIIITDLCSAFRSEDTEALGAAQED